MENLWYFVQHANQLEEKAGMDLRWRMRMTLWRIARRVLRLLPYLAYGDAKT
jgi:hypothetical protein